jgi:two-component system, chemotaxis family, sensor kinase CheA
MTYEIINSLIEKFSCDLVLADSKDSESLSSLLPELKKIHGNCLKLSLKETAKMILKARKIINSLIDDDSDNADKKMTALNELISKISLSINESQQSVQQQEIDLNNSNNKEHLDSFETNPIEKGESFDSNDIEANLDDFAFLIRGFCPGSIPDLGKMLNILDELIDFAQKKDFNTFKEIAAACKDYVEYMTLEDIHNIKPVEESLVLLKSVLNYEKKEEIFGFDYSDVLELLNIRSQKDQVPIKETQKKEQSDINETTTKKVENEKSVIEKPEQRTTIPVEEPIKVEDDDMEILVDFISEATENLDTIEINLLELEQDPENKDIINDIFRPFHTIKGVSGFLSLTKINTLSHTTENFLDSARNGDFIINDIATDVILESVDILKKLLDKVEEGTQTGFIPPAGELDIGSLTEKLKTLQTALANGETLPLGEILVQKGEITSTQLDEALERQKENPDKKIGEILAEEKKVAPKQIASALVDQNRQKKQTPKKQAAAQVKVSTLKLDDLVDYAGELVIAQSMLRQKTSHDTSLSQSVAQLGLIVTNMQTIAMSMRMIPIKATFMKMIRLVRDLSRKSGKEIALNMEGEDTEIDRNVVDALYEPMVHMIRNSCDHGIEEKPDRLKNGKSSQGTITLRAYHKGGHIIIEIEDDGKGLDRDVILEKAVSKGLTTGTEQLSDAQIFDFIMQPGFSTAKEVTDISGRGVGMDVVRSGIEKFRGQLKIDSEKGKGSKFTISLPLTLAIIDGMLIRVENERYVIPTMAIQKAFKPEEDECYTVEGKCEMVKDRGSLLPLIRLSKIFHNIQEKKSIHEKIVVVVESKDEKRALLVDELLGKDEYVIKSLGSNLEGVEGLSGGAILADGRVGLIIDIHGIFNLALNE